MKYHIGTHTQLLTVNITHPYNICNYVTVHAQSTNEGVNSLLNNETVFYLCAIYAIVHSRTTT